MTMRKLLILLLLATGVAAADDSSDQALAERIRTLTNRSSEGLIAEPQPNGAVRIGLQGRFQHVYLAQQGPDGELQAACVGTIGEANAFFGRNLETGAAVQRIHGQPKSDLAKRAAVHGMTAMQYHRYSKMDRTKQKHFAARRRNV